MPSMRLPHIREMSAPVAHSVLLGSIASRLRSHYADILDQPLPKSLGDILRRLP